MSDFLTIVYCYRNRDTERVRATLHSLSRQSRVDFRVLFIDYGSEPEIAEQVRLITDGYDFVEYIYSDTRYMPWNRSHALNIGIRLALTDYIFTADIDMVFEPEFVDRLNSLSSADSATFFKVAYLKQGVDPSGFNSNDVASYSAEHALGLALIPREVLNRLNGYDEFYRFWGREDNDIKLRLELNGTKTIFHDEILMYHIYHPPANTSDLLPDKWLQFQNDYLKHFSEVMVRNTVGEWGRVHKTSERSSIVYLNDPDSSYLQYKGFVRFFRYFLDDLVKGTNTGETFALRFDDSISDAHKRSKLSRIVRSLNRISGKLNLPFSIRSKYDFSYLELKMITDEFYFWLSSNRDEVADYAVQVQGNSVKIVVKKH